MSRSFSLLLVALVAWSCEGSGLGDAGPGAETGGDVSADPSVAWALSAEPSVTINAITTPDGDAPRIAGAFQLRDGTILVATSSPADLRYHDSSGRFLYSRSGTDLGDRDVRRIDWIRRIAGDSLAARDGATGDIVHLDPEGNVLGWQSTVGLVGMPPVPTVIGPLQDGSIYVGELLGRSEFVVGHGRVVQDTVVFRRFSATGAQLESLPPMPGHRYFISVDSTFFASPIPFSVRPQYVPYLDRMYLGSGGTEVEVRSAQGELLERLAVATSSRSITREDVERVAERERANGSHLFRGLSEAELATLIGVGDPAPGHGRIVVDTEAAVWVQEFGFEGPTDQWRVFAPDRLETRTISLPEGLRVTDITSTSVVGVRTEGGDVRVEVFALER